MREVKDEEKKQALDEADKICEQITKILEDYRKKVLNRAKTDKEMAEFYTVVTMAMGLTNQTLQEHLNDMNLKLDFRNMVREFEKHIIDIRPKGDKKNDETKNYFG